jgi:hypothetical protein
MNNAVGLLVLDELDQQIVILGNVQVDKLDLFSANFFPCLDTFLSDGAKYM